MHKSGFVNIIGLPNVGKSTLMNAMIGEKLSIVSPKAQTTRKRIIGIVNTEDYQIVFNDTPGILQPQYKMQQAMAKVVSEAIKDADIMVYLIEANMNEIVASGWLDGMNTDAKIFVVINKIDMILPSMLDRKLDFWRNHKSVVEAIGVSALEKTNLNILMGKLVEHLPEGEAYYSKEDLSDRNTRFFCGEYIREKIFLQFAEEIPYHTDVLVMDYVEKPDIDVIIATIIVNKESHKKIMIGKNGDAIKKLGTAARKDIEAFIGKKAFLELSVKVVEDWISSEHQLKKLGYIDYNHTKF
ncbi:MAG: GTPase Era [Bacteroidota bacterium]|jgi:GTP-binding protein Era